MEKSRSFDPFPELLAPADDMSIDRLINSDMPEFVYHYTDQNGLFGIFGSGELWATRIHCLNDHQEFRHGLEVLLEAILIRGGQPVSVHEKAELIAAFESVKSMNICVSSWSRHYDQLSQWRAYAKAKQGYALGLRTKDLARCAVAHSWRFGRCLYAAEDKQDISKAISEQFWRKLARYYEPLKSYRDVLHKLVFPYAAFFKHPGFFEEGEWRLVSAPISAANPSFVARPGGSFPVTYYRFPISGKLSKLDAELIVGPGLSQELAGHGAALAAARSTGFDVIRVKSSKTPWRTDS